MCEVLIRAGVSHDARTKVQRTPLHLATQEGHLPVVQLLISSGADLHAVDMVTVQCSATVCGISYHKQHCLSSKGGRLTDVYLLILMYPVLLL